MRLVKDRMKRKETHALTGVALVAMVLLSFWGSLVASRGSRLAVGLLPDEMTRSGMLMLQLGHNNTYSSDAGGGSQQGTTTKDRARLPHPHIMTLSWKTAMHFIDSNNNNNNRTCLLCSDKRFLPPLPSHNSLERLWSCPKQQVSDELSQTQQRKMPSTVILGAQKSGTTTLSHVLFSHPDIVLTPKKEIHFFSFSRHSLFQNGVPGPRARADYQHTLMEFKAPRKKKQATHFVDATPIYTFLSSRVPYWLLCTAPWIKAIVVLRNPVDRAYSEFNMYKQKQTRAYGKGIKSFEEWVGMDLWQLKKAGVIRSFDSPEDFAAFSGSTEELYAWDKYLRETSEDAPIGRGLYALQLRHWLQAFEHFQKPPSDLLVLQSEKMKTERDKIYRQILDHIGLDYHPSSSKDTHVRNYKKPMTNETRAMLTDFFEPYNQQLANVLGDEWDGVWDTNE